MYVYMKYRVVEQLTVKKLRSKDTGNKNGFIMLYSQICDRICLTKHLQNVKG